jgi:hypothetical protein
VYVTASPEERAKRRYKQLIEKGNSVNIESLLRDIWERDARDASRAAAPLKPATDAVLLDTTQMTIDAAVDAVLRLFRAAAAKPGTGAAGNIAVVQCASRRPGRARLASPGVGRSSRRVVLREITNLPAASRKGFSLPAANSIDKDPTR